MVDLLFGDLEPKHLLLELRGVEFHFESQYSLLGNADFLKELHEGVEEILWGFEAEGHVGVVEQVVLVDFEAEELHLGLVAELNEQDGLVVAAFHEDSDIDLALPAGETVLAAEELVPEHRLPLLNI